MLTRVSYFATYDGTTINDEGKKKFYIRKKMLTQFCNF